MPWWFWLAASVYAIGFGFGFVEGVRRVAGNDPLFPTFDPAIGGVFAGILWPFTLLTIVALMDLKRSSGPSRAEKRATINRRVAEERLREAQALKERERLLGIEQ